MWTVWYLIFCLDVKELFIFASNISPLWELTVFPDYMMQGQISKVWIYFPIDEQSDFWCFPVFSPKPLHCHIMVVSPVYCGDGCSWIFLSGFRFAKRSWMTQGNLFWKRIMWKRKKKNTDLQVIWKWKCCRVLPCCLLQYICSINLGEALAGELID